MNVSTEAKKMVAIPAAQESSQYLTFSIGREIFAIDILYVKEIIEHSQLTVVPLMPDYIRGVINLRGSVVPVIDLSARFGGRATELTRRTCVVIVEMDVAGERRDVGIMVDAVSEVLDMLNADIEPAPLFGAHIRADFIHGMGKVDGKFVIILNVKSVLTLASEERVLESSGKEIVGAVSER